MNAKFDGLAEVYDQSRPRYPSQLFEPLVQQLPPDAAVLDCGAGTGIALESIIPLLGGAATVSAVDISADMIRLGEKKFPQVRWYQAEAEVFLRDHQPFDLIIAAQSYQWMYRPRYLAAVKSSLSLDGICAVVQNNRDFSREGIALDYEDLLERYSPGYNRHYRSFDVSAELSQEFPSVSYMKIDWERPMSIEEFVTMSSSSTQAQRAIDATGETFLSEVEALALIYAGGPDGEISLPYSTELIYGVNAG